MKGEFLCLGIMQICPNKPAQLEVLKRWLTKSRKVVVKKAETK